MGSEYTQRQNPPCDELGTLSEIISRTPAGREYVMTRLEIRRSAAEILTCYGAEPEGLTEVELIQYACSLLATDTEQPLE